MTADVFSADSGRGDMAAPDACQQSVQERSGDVLLFLLGGG